MNKVMVGSAGSRKTGMHIISYRLYALHRYILWKYLVQPIGKLGAIKLLFKIKMSHHHPGMHTSICPTGSNHLCLLSKQGGECLLQRFLHTDTIGLYLPPMIVCAVV
jgi:hypothetical protein